MDLFQQNFSGREPLTKDLMNELTQRMGLGRFIQEAVSSAPLGGLVGSVFGVGRGASLSDPSGGAESREAAGTVSRPPVILGLAGPPGASSGFSFNLAGFTNSPPDAWILRLGTNPGDDAVIFLGSPFGPDQATALPAGLGVASYVPSHDGRQGMYSMTGAWLAAGGRPREAYGFLFYNTGYLTGGTYRVGQGSSWSSSLSYSSSPSIGVDELGYSNAVSGLGLNLPALVVLTGNSASLSYSLPAFSVDSQVTGGADALGRGPAVYCARVLIPRSPGSMPFPLPDYDYPHTLTWHGQTTATLPAHASAAQTQAALEALSNIGSGNVAVIRYPVQDFVDLLVGSAGLDPFYIFFLGGIEDLSFWSTITVTNTDDSSQTVISPINLFSASPRAGSSSWGDYWNASPTDDDLAFQAGTPTSLSIDAAIVPQLRRDASIVRHLLLEYGHPGGYVVARKNGIYTGNALSRPLPIRRFSRATLLTWQDTGGVAGAGGPQINLESNPSTLRPVDTPGRIGTYAAGPRGVEPLLAQFHNVAALRAPAADDYRPDIQRPIMARWMFTQQAVISDAPGRPIALADGYLIDVLGGDTMTGSGYGDQVYVRGGADYQARSVAGIAPFDLVAQSDLLLHRWGSVRGICFRNGLSGSIPSVHAPASLMAGINSPAISTDTDVPRGLSSNWTTTWNWTATRNPGGPYRALSSESQPVVTLGASYVFPSPGDPTPSYMLYARLNSGDPFTLIGTIAIDADRATVLALLEFAFPGEFLLWHNNYTLTLDGGGFPLAIVTSFQIGRSSGAVATNLFDTDPPVGGPTPSGYPTMSMSYGTLETYLDYAADQTRSIRDNSRGGYGQIVSGQFQGGPAMGMTADASVRRRDGSGNPVDEVFYSGKATDDGYVCFMMPFSPVAPPGTLMGNYHYNVSFPIRLSLAGDLLASSINLYSTGIDVHGQINYADELERVVSSGRKTATFQSGLAWTGSAVLGGHTLWFLLTVCTREPAKGWTPGLNASGDPRAFACRLYVYCDFPPVWPPPAMLLGGNLFNLAHYSPGLVGVSQISWLQFPMESTGMPVWSFSVPIGSGGLPPGTTGVSIFHVSSDPTGGYSYGPALADSGGVFSGTDPRAGLTLSGLPVFADYTGSSGGTCILGRCCNIGSLRLTLSDTSAGSYGASNLFSRLRSASSLLSSSEGAHARVWELGGDATYSLRTYLAVLQPDALGSYTLTFAVYNPDEGTYAPLNCADPSGGVQISGSLTWSGSCTSFSCSGTIHLYEPGIGRARISVSIST